MKYIVLILLAGGTGCIMGVLIHYGNRWVDRMLCVRPPLDPNKPIVRKR